MKNDSNGAFYVYGFTQVGLVPEAAGVAAVYDRRKMFTPAALAPEAAGAAAAESGVSPTRVFHTSAGSCHSLNGRAALPRRPESGRSSIFALPDSGMSGPSLFSVGIDEPHPPFFRRYGKVAAVLSRVAQSDFCGPAGEKNLQDLAWLAPRACRHEAVLEQVMRLGAVLPARFGTLFSSTATLDSFLRKHEDAMSRFLERVGGQEEWAVKGFLDQARAETEWLARRRSEEPSLPGSPPGMAYLQEQSLRIQAREASDKRVAEVCGHLLDELNLLASEIVPRRILPRERPDAAREMVLNWALLLPSAAVADFRGRIERANVEQNVSGLALEVSGPWPPYSFCPVLETEPATAVLGVPPLGGPKIPPTRLSSPKSEGGSPNITKTAPTGEGP